MTLRPDFDKLEGKRQSILNRGATMDQAGLEFRERQTATAHIDQIAASHRDWFASLPWQRRLELYEEIDRRAVNASDGIGAAIARLASVTLGHFLVDLNARRQEAEPPTPHTPSTGDAPRS